MKSERPSAAPLQDGIAPLGQPGPGRAPSERHPTVLEPEIVLPSGPSDAAEPAAVRCDRAARARRTASPADRAAAYRRRGPRRRMTRRAAAAAPVAGGHHDPAGRRADQRANSEPIVPSGARRASAARPAPVGSRTSTRALGDGGRAERPLCRPARAARPLALAQPHRLAAARSASQVDGALIAPDASAAAPPSRSTLAPVGGQVRRQSTQSSHDTSCAPSVPPGGSRRRSPSGQSSRASSIRPIPRDVLDRRRAGKAREQVADLPRAANPRRCPGTSRSRPGLRRRTRRPPGRPRQPLQSRTAPLARASSASAHAIHDRRSDAPLLPGASEAASQRRRCRSPVRRQPRMA